MMKRIAQILSVSYLALLILLVVQSTAKAADSETRTYKAPQAKIVDAVKKYYRNDGVNYQCTQDGSSMKIETEVTSFSQSSTVGLMFGKSNYSVKQTVFVEANGEVSFSARFTKSLGGFVNSEGLKYPEQEAQLRSKLFSALDKELL